MKPPADNAPGRWERIGEVGVDSGQLMITDPCYIGSQWKDTQFADSDKPTGEFSYDGACRATCGDTQAGQLNYELGHSGAGVVFSSGYGDGCYEVWARYIDDPDWGTRIAEVRVIMIDDDEDESDDEEESEDKDPEDDAE